MESGENYLVCCYLDYLLVSLIEMMATSAISVGQVCLLCSKKIKDRSFST